MKVILLSIFFVVLSFFAIVALIFKYKNAEKTSEKIAVIAGFVASALAFFISIGWLSVGTPPWKWIDGLTTVKSEESISEIPQTAEDELTDGITELNSTNHTTVATTAEAAITASVSSASDTVQVVDKKESIDILHEDGLLTQFHGEMKNDDQEDSYTYIPIRDGTYRFEITGMYAERQVHICICDSGGGKIEENNWIGNSDGITMRNLIPNTEYTIKVKQARNYSPYDLLVYSQAETVEVSGTKEVKDEIIFRDQENKYLFVPPLDGRYRFEIDQLYAEKRVSLFILDEGEGTVKSETWIENGEGITIDSLQTNQKYTIVVQQTKDFSPYSLKIGYPSASQPLEIGKTLENSIEFTDEEDIFTFIPPKEGGFTFTITGLQTDKRVSLYLTDEGGGTIASDTWIGNDESLNSGQIQYGKTYYLKVEQSRGYSPYSITVNYSPSD